MDQARRIKRCCGICGRKWIRHRLALPICQFVLERIVRRCSLLTQTCSRPLVRCILIREFPSTDPEFLMAIEQGMHPEDAICEFGTGTPAVLLNPQSQFASVVAPASQMAQMEDSAATKSEESDETRVQRVLNYVESAIKSSSV